MEVAAEAIAVAAGVLLLVGFICDYGVRALISRWHRMKAGRRHFEPMAEEIAEKGKQERLKITRDPPEG